MDTSATQNHSTDEFGNQEMYVTKRNGKKEIISFDKILKRIFIVIFRFTTEKSINIFNLTNTLKSTRIHYLTRNILVLECFRRHVFLKGI